MEAIASIWVLLDRLPGDVVALVGSEASSRPGLTLLSVHGGEWQRIAAFKTALETLNAGGFVFLAVDELGSAEVEATLFGRKIRLARGAFALAQLSGAPLVPVTARWRGRKCEVILGEPIAPGPESDMAGALSRWLEAYLSETPGALERPIVRRLWDQPAGLA